MTELEAIAIHLDATGHSTWARAVERLVAENRTLSEELLRVRTRGHGAAHELDNIAVEAGLGHSPAPGVVADYVRRLRTEHLWPGH